VPELSRARIAAVIASAVTLAGATAEVAAAATALDPSFGAGGQAIVSAGDSSAVNAAALDHEGRVVLAGRITINGLASAFVARLLPNGTPDTAFGADGVVTFRNGAASAAHAVAVRPDGRLVIAGSSGVTGENQRFLLAQLTADGLLDRTFGRKGRVLTKVGRRHAAFALDLALQHDGKIVSIGTADGRVAIVRYRRSGAVDKSFARDGRFASTRGAVGTGVAVRRSGAIVVSAYTSTSMLLLQVRRKGVLDRRFGAEGRVRPAIPAHYSSFGADVQFDRQDRIVVAGGAQEEPPRVEEPTDERSRMVVVRAGRDGSPDPSFGSQGVQLVDAGQFAGASSIALDEQDRILVGGSTFDPGEGEVLALARLAPDGFLDGSFGEGGLVRAVVGDSGQADLGALLIAPPDGPLIAAGTTRIDGASRGIALRYSLSE
jgi:uncharacterized delta-60 repeat protein